MYRSLLLWAKFIVECHVPKNIVSSYNKLIVEVKQSCFILNAVFYRCENCISILVPWGQVSSFYSTQLPSDITQLFLSKLFPRSLSIGVIFHCIVAFLKSSRTFSFYWNPLGTMRCHHSARRAGVGLGEDLSLSSLNNKPITKASPLKRINNIFKEK